MRVRALAMTALLLAGCVAPPAVTRDETPVSQGAEPRFSKTGPGAQDYLASDGYPKGDRTTFYTVPYLVGTLSRMDEIFEGRVVRKAATASPLRRAAAEAAITWKLGDQEYGLDDYLARNPATGLLIARGDTILVELYQYARTDTDRFTSWSMAKTVTAMLIGIAVAEGKIRSVEDTAATYAPVLAGSAYGATTLRDLLQMSSGVRFIEDYTANDDVRDLAIGSYVQGNAGGPALVTRYNNRVAPAGTRFYYASAETQTLGFVLRAVTGKPVAEYLHEKIWAPMGAEADATWLIDKSGQEATYCCLNAVLRDYARLGLLLAHDGNWRGKQLIPEAWIGDATTLRDDQPHLKPVSGQRFFGYGYQTWIFPATMIAPEKPRRMFALLGVRGQTIYVDPQTRTVLVHTAVRKQSLDPGGRETIALWAGTLRTLGD